MKFPKSLEILIFELEKLPGVGPKMAFRIALYLFKNRSQNGYLEKAIEEIGSLKVCSVCRSISDNLICEICNSQDRDKRKLMIVEDFQDEIVIENSKAFNGYYFVLGGVISPVSNIMPENLCLPALYKRILALLSSEEKGEFEIIFGLNPTMEGESTIIYIQKDLEKLKILCKCSRLALGVPRGSDIDYIDEDTLKYSINSRNHI